MFTNVDRKASVSQAFVSYRIDSFNELFRKYINGFRMRLEESDNVLIRACVSSSYFIYKSDLNTHWYSVLFI